MKFKYDIASIPNKTKDLVKSELRSRASQVKKGLFIVEVGAWLGSSTGHLALGTQDSGNNNPIHAFDKFTANEADVAKAKEFGIYLFPGEDTQQIFNNFMEPFSNVVSHKISAINSKWNGGEIGLYVYNATKKKPEFDRCMNVFGKCFIKGTILMLLNFYFYEKQFKSNVEDWQKYRYQEEYMEANKDSFEFLCRIENSPAAVFKKK